MHKVLSSVAVICALIAVRGATAVENQKPAPAKGDFSAFGGKENEARLRKSIHDTVAVPPRKASISKQAESLLRWSEEVGGLAARIEYVSVGYRSYCGFTVLVRLKNVSQKPLVVPTGNPVDDAKEVIFSYTRNRSTASGSEPIGAPRRLPEGRADDTEKVEPTRGIDSSGRKLR